MRARKCEQCRKQFHLRYRNAQQRFCSRSCFTNSTRLLDDRVCKYCGLTFRPHQDSAYHCSSACANASRRRPDVTCRGCGIIFSQPRGNKRTYCSRACSDKKRSLPELICKQCGISFQPRTSFSKGCCSNACRAAASRTIEPRECKWCKTRWTPASNKTVFCSMLCAKNSQRTLKPKRCKCCRELFQPRQVRSTVCSTACRVGARRSVHVVFGIIMTRADMAKVADCSVSTIFDRLQLKMTPEQALTMRKKRTQ